MTSNGSILSSSFRDPDGFMFTRDGVLYRQVNRSYRENYLLFKDSGLYDELVSDQMLVSHEEVPITPADEQQALLVLQPQQVPFISYASEWCFSMLQEAALLTLAVQKTALLKGMLLKDASSFNVQFLHGKMIFIDTLSFEKFRPAPWSGYRQFCQHFLAPLSLMAYTDLRLGRISAGWVDGLPLDLAAELLPIGSWFRPATLLHIHLHAMSQKRYSTKGSDNGNLQIKDMTLEQHLALVDQLDRSVKAITPGKIDTAWTDYTNNTNYSQHAAASKFAVVKNFLDSIGHKQKLILDIGANTGDFSILAAEYSDIVISADQDEAVIEKNRLRFSATGTGKIIPLVIDLSSPTPATGWANNERMSFSRRCQADTLLALALIHHLAIANNLPFLKIAAYFSQLAENLVIEFVPGEDTQVQAMFSTRKDIFVNYTQENFEKDFSSFFTILDKHEVNDSMRTLYLMRKKN